MSTPKKTHLQRTSLFVELVQNHFGDKLISAVLYGSVAHGHERPDYKPGEVFEI